MTLTYRLVNNITIITNVDWASQSEHGGLHYAETNREYEDEECQVNPALLKDWSVVAE